MLKGSSIPNVLILVALLFTLVVLFYDITPSWYEGLREDAILHRDLYMMNNSLQAARSYMDTALSYSVYQACYDTLRKTDASAGDDVFKANLAESVKSYLNRYGSDDYYFMSNYPVNIPVYETVTVETISLLRIKAESSQNMYISMEQEGSERRLETRNNMDKTIPIDCYGMFLKGKEVHSGISSTLDSLVKAKVDSWPDKAEALPDLDSLKAGIEGIQELAFERIEGHYSIKSEFTEAKIEFNGYEKSGAGPYENIKYKVTVKLRVTVKDTRDDQVFPIYDGSKITFSPLSAIFTFEEAYAG